MEYNLYDYDERYNNDICKLENEEIKKWLKIFIKEREIVLDIGAGTGLVTDLLEKRNLVISTDINPQSRDIIMRKKNSLTLPYTMNATAALTIFQFREVITCMFALHYLKFKDIWKILKSRSVCVIYNKPYIHPYSVYSNKPFRFYSEHLIKHLFIKFCLFVLGIKEIPLMGQNAYSLIVTGQ